MTTVQLDDEQTETLRTTLQGALSGLRFEIAHTDHRDFRTLLVHREQVLERVLSALGGGAAPAQE